MNRGLKRQDAKTPIQKFIYYFFWRSVGLLALLAFLCFGFAVGESNAHADPLLAGTVTKEQARAIAREVRARGFYAGEPTGAGPCGGCHADVAAQWAASAHRFSSFNNPYYRISVEDFRRERGFAASKFCGACHEPLLAASGAITRAVDVTSADAQAGIVCLVCHSIDEVPDLEGNGGYRLHPAPFPSGKPAHGARLRPAILGAPELCGSCHKVGLGPEVTHDRWLRGQDDYDAWQASAASGNGAAATFRPASTNRCQDCHMPLEPAVLGDAAAKNGQIRSHRFLGANSALPQLRGDPEQAAREAAFLDGAVSLELAWSPAGQTDRVDVVLANRRVGHRFPGGTNDSNLVWLEVEARDAAGGLVGRSGALDRAGALDADAHLVRAQPVDGEGRPLERRDPQHMRGVAFDASLSPSEPQVVRYTLPPGTAQVRARLLYRKFTAAYAKRACGILPRAARRACEAVPTVEVARATLAAGAAEPDDWRRLTEHGLGLALALADSASEAEPILERARSLAPDRPEPLIGLARLMSKLGRTDEAVAFAERASALAPEHPAPPWIAASALLDAYRAAPARAPAERLLSLRPRDRAALALAARIRGLDGDPAAALDAADRLCAVDPDLDECWYQRALSLAELGRADEAERAQAQYLAHRVAQELDLELRRKWRARRGAAPDESVPVHTHALAPAAR
ncbi:MAG TPA: tetratricopeptide repeat protein [Polyangia bacterium]|nr:tetratricopeptide repeat protein [Polyangia bacterium]